MDRAVPVRALRRLRDRGMWHALAFARHHLSERVWELRLGIETAERSGFDAPVVEPNTCQPYAPIPYRSFLAAMQAVVIGEDDVFLDYGAGRGRAVILAARFPFRSVIGVEISPALAEAARENLRRARRHLRCRDVRILTADAAEIATPDEATVFHFFDPFKGTRLDRVLERMRMSLRREPRRVTLLFADPNHFEPKLEHLPWVKRVAEVPFPYVDRTSPSSRPYYGIYRTG